MSIDDWLGPLILTLGVVAALALAITGVVRLIKPAKALQQQLEALEDQPIFDRAEGTLMKLEVAAARLVSLEGMLERLRIALADLQRAREKMLQGVGAVDLGIGLVRLLFGRSR